MPLGAADRPRSTRHRAMRSRVHRHDDAAPIADHSSFDDALAELQRTVAELEAGGLPLERTLALHERGAALLERCDRSSRAPSCGCGSSSPAGRHARERRRQPGRVPKLARLRSRLDGRPEQRPRRPGRRTVRSDIHGRAYDPSPDVHPSIGADPRVPILPEPPGARRPARPDRGPARTARGRDPRDDHRDRRRRPAATSARRSASSS